MCNGALGLTKGFAGREFHDPLVERYTRHIDLVADAGYRNHLLLRQPQRYGPA